MDPTRVPAGQRTKERVGGVILAAAGAALVAFTWRSALADGAASRKAAMLGPAVMVLGLALLIMPGYRTERLARGEDLQALSGAALITPRWWGVLVVALAAGIGHVGWLVGWWG